MTETTLRLLTRLSEAGNDAILSGDMAASIPGPVFKRLLARGVLIEQAPLTYWDTCDLCDCGLAARKIRPNGAGFRAECPLDRRRDIELSEDDLRAYSIEAVSLASAIGITAGFSADSPEIAAGLWMLGSMASGRSVFLALEVCSVAYDGALLRLRLAAKEQGITLLGPKLPTNIALTFEDAGILAVETAHALIPGSGPFGAAIDGGVLEPAASKPKLQLRSGTGEVQWMGRSVILSHQLFPVFRQLADAGRTRDPIVSGPKLEGTSGREAKDLIRELRDAFKAAGFSQEEVMALILVARSRGYHLGIPAADIVIDG